MSSPLRGHVLGALALIAAFGETLATSAAEVPFVVGVGADATRVARQARVDLERLVADAAARAFALLPHRGRIAIEVQLDPSRSIPEIGVGGFTDPESGDVFLWIDDTPPGGLRAALETWVPATVAHELHHSSRVRTGPGYGRTLGEALVTEGMADHFVAEVFPATPPLPWDHALSEEQRRALWQRAEPRLWEAYDHRLWFYGGPGVPRWAGYTLGYGIVEAYLGESGSAAAAVEIKARTIVARARPGG